MPYTARVEQKLSKSLDLVTKRSSTLSRRALLGVAGAAPLALGACAPAAVERVRPAAPPVELSYWKSLSGPRHDAQVALVDRFNTQQSEARVTLEHAGEYNALSEKLRVALASGAPPDIVMLGSNADMPAFARIQALEPLEPLAAADKTFKLDAFYPNFIKDSRAAGTLFALPFARSVPLLFANRDHLRAAGLPDGLPTTWSALIDRGLTLMRTRAAEDQVKAPYAAFGSGTGWWEFQPLLWAHGGAFSDERRTVTVDTPPSIAAAQLLSDVVHRHRIGVGTKNVIGDFQRGALTFFVTSTASLTQLVDGSSFDVGAAAVPALFDHTPIAIPSSGAGLSLIRGVPGRIQEKGWDFLRFMTNAESASFFARATGYTPVRPDAMRDPALAAFYDRSPGARTALAQLERVKPVDAVLSVPFANRRIEEFLEQILFAGAAVPAACAALATTLRQLVEAA